MRTRALARLREEVEDTIEKLIAFLDRLDGDPDLEPTFGYLMPGAIDEAEPDVDFEPSLGCATSGYASETFSQEHWDDGGSPPPFGREDMEDDGESLDYDCGVPWVPNWPPALYSRKWGGLTPSGYAPPATERRGCGEAPFPPKPLPA